MWIVREEYMQLERLPESLERRVRRDRNPPGTFTWTRADHYAFQAVRDVDFGVPLDDAHASIKSFIVATVSDHDVERVYVDSEAQVTDAARGRVRVIARAMFRDESPDDDTYLMEVEVQVLGRRRGGAAHVATGLAAASDWRDYDGAQPGIVIDVDTSSGGFRTTPHYTVSITGRSLHWRAVGAQSIYNASPTSFRVYLSWASPEDYPDYNPLRSRHARDLDWALRWTGVEAP